MVNKNWSLDGRVCRDCQQFKPLSEYNLRKTGTPYTLCRPCFAADIKKRAAKKEVLPGDSVRSCTDCGASKIISEFPRNSNSAGGYLNRCKGCYARRVSIGTWGIDTSLNTHCDICEEPFNRDRDRQVVVDHDHTCCPGNKSCGKCVRGVLCPKCNWGLGHFRDNPAYLRAAANYLEES